MSKLNTILVVVLLAQLALITGMRVAGDRDAPVRSLVLFEGLEPEKVTSIEIRGATPKEKDDPPQSSVKLVKQGGKWGIADADGYPAESSRVDDFLKQIAALRSHDVVLTQGTYHEKLEVAEDKYAKKVILESEGKPVTLFIGTSPSFKNVHVRLGGQDEVYLVNDLSPSDAGDRAWSWVARDYLKYAQEQVWQVRVDNAKGSFQLEKDPATGDWAALGAAGALAKTTVDDLVRKASNIALESPVGKTELPEHGLSAPLATITLVTGTSTVAGKFPPTTETHTLRIGTKLEKENQYYVKASNSEYVVRVTGWSLQPLVEKGKDDLVEKPADKSK